MKQPKIKIEEKLYPVVELKFHENKGELARITFMKGDFYVHVFQGSTILDNNFEVIDIEALTKGNFGDYYAPDLSQLLRF